MASFGMPKEKIDNAKKNLPKITLTSLIDPRNDWVLVPNGSLLGFFDWVPENLRVGRWKTIAFPTLLGIVFLLYLTAPLDDKYDLQVSTYPSEYTKLWYYNSIAFMLMAYMFLWICRHRSKGVVVTFTILSWITNFTRHGINALAPFLPNQHFLLKINHVLRFPALLGASITFTVWNFVLFPYVYVSKLDTEEKKNSFLDFNFKFRLVQQHVCNIIYAILNTMVTGSLVIEDGSGKRLPKLFDEEDLWYGGVYVMGYGLFYTMILDRLGVHLYPVFSPRSNLVLVTWLLIIMLIFGFYKFWNWMMVNHFDILSFERLLIVNLVLILSGITCSKLLVKPITSKPTPREDKVE